MKFVDLLRIANRNLFRNKLRTFLTVIAIFVGSFTLTLTNGLGDGLRDYVENQVKNIEGNEVVFVRKKIEVKNGAANGGEPQEYSEEPLADDGVMDPNTLTFTLPQMQAALKGIDGVKSVTPQYNIQSEYITIEGKKKFRAPLGMMSDGISQKTEAGHTINGNRQVVIPIGLARAFDPDIETLIGKTATLAYKGSDGTKKTLPLKIVGVATKGFQTNENSFVDAETAAKIYEDQRQGDADLGKFSSFTVRLDPADDDTITAFKDAVSKKGFEASTIADLRKRTYDAIGIFKTGMNLFAFVALLAASFGIINTLVIAVMERTKEIGLQKALGMGRGKIFAIFSMESVLIGFWGALLGTVLGILAGVIANKLLVTSFLASFEGYSLFVFRLPSIAFVIAIVCGIAFAAGVLPAWRASRLNPIESLRYE